MSNGMTHKQEEAIENLADAFMGAVRGPAGVAIGAELMVGMREGFKGHLRLARLPIPNDAYLDALLREMAEWHDLPLATGGT
jgi:hypothetical protein